MASRYRGESSSKRAPSSGAGQGRRRTWCTRTSFMSSSSRWDSRILPMLALTLVKEATSERDETRHSSFWLSSTKSTKTPAWRQQATTGWSRFQSLPIWRQIITKRRQRWSQIISLAILGRVHHLLKMNHGVLGPLGILARHSYSNEQRHISTRVFWPIFMRKGQWCRLRTITHDWKLKEPISTESNTPAKDRDDKDQATVELQVHEFYRILEDTRCHYQ